MRTRDRILENLEAIYRESYERSRADGLASRMVELENAYMRDQLMLEILLDIRDLFSVAPAAKGGNALETLERLRPGVEWLLDRRDYAPAMQQLAGLRPAVDAFFEQVMVMAEDPAVRTNRLALLARLRTLFLRVADLSRLPG